LLPPLSRRFCQPPAGARLVPVTYSITSSTSLLVGPAYPSPRQHHRSSKRRSSKHPAAMIVWRGSEYSPKGSTMPATTAGSAHIALPACQPLSTSKNHWHLCATPTNPVSRQLAHLTCLRTGRPHTEGPSLTSERPCRNSCTASSAAGRQRPPLQPRRPSRGARTQRSPGSGCTARCRSRSRP
jgi:hypothetical protein